MDVLEGFPFDLLHINFITIEHNSYSIGSFLKNKIKFFLLSNNFVMYKEDVSNNSCVFEDWYINKQIK
jgi:hypothetical protein